MKIIDITYNWNGSLIKRDFTKYIILHHRAGDGDVQSIHNLHLNKGWVGIGYHFYVKKDGSIYRGRPVDTVGAHTTNYNSASIGICFEGNFENETMSAPQLEAAQELIFYLKNLYSGVEVKRHKDCNNTSCPGKNFPSDAIIQKEIIMTIDKAKEIVKVKAGLENSTINFLLCYKYGEELLIKLAKAMK